MSFSILSYSGVLHMYVPYSSFIPVDIVTDLLSVPPRFFSRVSSTVRKSQLRVRSMKMRLSFS